jgi:hypothetical protein
MEEKFTLVILGHFGIYLKLTTMREVLARAIRQEKEIKKTQIGKEESKLLLFADDIILYIETPKDFVLNPKNVQTDNLIKIAGHKINIQ